MKFSPVISFFLLLIIVCCESDNPTPQNARDAFIAARTEYDNENYDLSLTSLAEFKTQFPYSQYAIDAELMLANANFFLERYAEAAAAYEQFISLHPKHSKAAYAQFQVGQSYWEQAPEAIDREQDITRHALDAWATLVEMYPSSNWAKQARELILEGEERIAKNEAIAAQYYCEQGIWHACAYRSLYVVENFARFQTVASPAAEQAAEAFEKLANLRETIEDSKELDKNLFFKNMTANQLRDKSIQMKKIQQKLES